ncbi:hypothetical protein [Mycobacterium sp. NPDC006124]|uniref:hypothetical protein n=1 Tax=Mycobacterium sp. NPDC006124 TaxID=3156729 RepID=UPI0033AD73C5
MNRFLHFQAQQLRVIAELFELAGLLPDRWLSRAIPVEVARLGPFLDTPAGQEQLALYLDRVGIVLGAAAAKWTW